MYINSTASTRMIDGEYELGNYMKSTTDRSARENASCWISGAKKRRKLDSQFKNTQGELVKICLEALIVPGLGANLLCRRFEEGGKVRPVPRTADVEVRMSCISYLNGHSQNV